MCWCRRGCVRRWLSHLEHAIVIASDVQYDNGSWRACASKGASASCRLRHACWRRAFNGGFFHAGRNHGSGQPAEASCNGKGCLRKVPTEEPTTGRTIACGEIADRSGQAGPRTRAQIPRPTCPACKSDRQSPRHPVQTRWRLCTDAPSRKSDEGVRHFLEECLALMQRIAVRNRHFHAIGGAGRLPPQ